MGSWNLSCAVSRFPVHCGDAVRAIFVARNPQPPKHPGGLLNSTDLWAPISLPIAMSFDDYGRLSPIDPQDWRLEMMLGAMGGATLDQVLGQIHDGALMLAGPPQHPTEVPMSGGLMVIHEAVYGRLTRSFYDLGQNTTPQDLLEQNVELFQQMREMKSYSSFSLPETGSLSFWFQNRSSSGTVAIRGPHTPSPVDVVGRIRAAASIEAARPAMEATCEMFVLNENLGALSVPYLPCMQASDDFDPDLLRELHVLAEAAYDAE